MQHAMIVAELCMLDGSPPDLLRRSRARCCSCCWKKSLYSMIGLSAMVVYEDTAVHATL